MAKSTLTKYGWITEYTDKEREYFKKQNEKAQEKYILPTIPLKRGECKYCGDKVEALAIICEDCYSVEF